MAQTGRLVVLHVAVLAALSATAPAGAVVDMKNANYSDGWTDFDANRLGLVLSRQYDSRSTFNGLWGYGWSSVLDQSIQPVGVAGVSFYQGGPGQEELFHHVNVERAWNHDRLLKVLDRRGLTPPQRSVLRGQLGQSSELYTEWAMSAGAHGAGFTLGDYLGEGGSTMEVTAAGAHIASAGGGESWFDPAGRLVRLRSRSGVLLTIRRAGRRWTLASERGELTFDFDASAHPHITRISDAKGAIATFTYVDDNLVDATNEWKNEYLYTYGEAHKLTRVVFPDGSERLMTYNAEMDWVTSFQDRKVGSEPVCREIFRYNMGSLAAMDPARDHERRRLLAAMPVEVGEPSAFFTDVAVKRCGDAYTNYGTFFFEHRDLPGGGRQLSRVTTITAGKELAVVYGPNVRPAYISYGEEADLASFAYSGDLVSTRDPIRVAKLSFSHYCSDFQPVDAWMTPEPGGPRHVRIRVSYLSELAGGKCRASRVVVEADGRSVDLAYEWSGDVARSVAVDGVRYALAAVVKAPPFSWTPACLGVSRTASKLDTLRALSLASATGACDRGAAAVTLLGLMWSDSWGAPGPNDKLRPPNPAAGIPEATIPAALRQP